MFIVSGELTPLSWWLIGLVCVFTLQLALCMKAKRTAVKCIPLCLTLCLFLLGAAEYLGLFGRSSAGDISGNQLVGVLILAFAASLCVGVADAWLVYWIVRAVKSRRP